MICYIAGASSRARTAKVYIESLNPDAKVGAFLVSPEMDDNPSERDGICVKKILSDSNIDTKSKIYIGTRGVNHEKLINELIGIGFEQSNIIPITPELDTVLRNDYVFGVFEKAGKKFEKIDDISSDSSKTSHLGQNCSNKIYIAKTEFDNDFEHPIGLNDYESLIQAGTVIGEKRLSKVSFYDDIGDNISDKNQQFCELTALYWIWKNSKEDVVGLEHWRRRFLLPNNWMSIFVSNDIDVILPTPLCVMPSLEENFKDRHVPKVWDTAMELLKEEHPEDYEDAVSFFKECNIYSPCNMLIAKRDVLNEYCEWLFPVLLRLSEKIGTLDDKYQNRYPGFVAERLENFFFHKNEDRFRIVYADKSFLS